ncbi:rho GTPase-activating protein 29-like isoform X2 [Mytilus californianus]|uniref:rho GTPase-activating protein 29-like isoform X2 n=1 Tax=Mytilus californianus TaxID=6549 RepID=UPI002246E9C9|nr:rho GTPase-activating protein 29-like isoform X2 [Mytilus californianus]
MSTKGRILGIHIGSKSKKKSNGTDNRDQNSTDEGDTVDTTNKMTKSSSLTSIPTSEPEKLIVDQSDIITLTQDVKCFSDGLNRLKAVFEDHDSTDDLRVTIHERLGEVLSILKNLLHQYPALQSTELFAASGSLITKVKSYNQGGSNPDVKDTSLYEAIDQLALAFSSGVSDYLMGDMGSAFLEKETKGTKSCEDLLSAKDEEKGANNQNEVKQLSTYEIDRVLSQLEAGVDVALQRAKAWSKYMKDITSYIERKAHLETEYSKNLARLAQTMRPVLTEEGFLPLQSVYCTVLSQDIEYASTCQATQILLQTSKFVEPLTARRLEHDKMRKTVKDSWMKEVKKMHEAVQSLRKAQAMYFQRQHEYEKAKEQASKLESDMLSQSSASALTKMDKRRKLEDDAMHRAAEAETTYKACVVEANTRKTELENTKTELLAKIREQIFLCDQVIKSVTIEYFHLLQTVTAPIPVQYHTISETSKQYEVGFQYGEFVKRLPVTDKNSMIAEPFAFEPYINGARDAGRKTSTQSTGSGSSDHHSQDESPSFTGDRKDKYRVAVKAWPVGSDTDSGSSKSSPSNSPHQTGRRTLKTAKSLDELTEGDHGGGFLQIPPCILKGVDVSIQGMTKGGGKRRNTTFGVDFQEQVEQWKSAVPPIVKRCLKEVEQRGITLRGIYRVSGVKSKVEGLCQRFEKDPDSIELSEEHPNVISNVLKLYLRQLPEPLLTFKMYSEFIHLAKESVAGALTLDETIEKLGVLISKLPYSNFKTCGVLMYHLQRVASFNSVNQMTSSNLGIVFGPTLLRPLEGTASLASLVDTPHQTRTVELLITNAQLIFGPETEYELIPGETPIEPITEKSQPKPDTSTKIVITKDDVKAASSPNILSAEKTVDQLVQGDNDNSVQSKTSDADFVLPGSAHCNKKEIVPLSDGESSMVLNSDHGNHFVRPPELIKRSPPQVLKIQPATIQALTLEKKKINLPTITVIESSPIREYPPQHNFAATLAQTTTQSNPTHALSESHPLSMASHDSTTETPTIQALIKATKATFSIENFKSQSTAQTDTDALAVEKQVILPQVEVVKTDDEDSNNNAPTKPKPSDLPPLNTLTITCPSSPLLQRHALMQAQKEAGNSSPPVLRRNTSAKRSPPLFRTSLTDIGNKSREADGHMGSLSPKLSRRFSGQGSSLSGSWTRSSSSLDSKEGSISPLLSIHANISDKMDETASTKMEIDEKNTLDLDMTVRSGMFDTMNVKKTDMKKNVTFSLDLDTQSLSSDISSKDGDESHMDMSVQSAVPTVKTKPTQNKTDQSKPVVKERKKKGPLGIVMGKAAIAARAVSSGAQRSISSSSSSSSPKQPVTSTKPDLKPERKHSHSQCVMGTSAAHSSRTGHISCATCGRRRAASQSNVASEPPTKQQAKGKQAPVRKISTESYPRKTTDTTSSSKYASTRESSDKSGQKPSKKSKTERRPFFV